MIANIIGGFIAVFIGVILFGEIRNEIEQAVEQDTLNQTAASAQFSQSILDMLPILFSLAILGVGLSIMYNVLRSSGVIGGYSVSDSEESVAHHLHGKHVEKVYKGKLIECNRCEWEKLYGHTEDNGKLICEDCALETKLLGDDEVEDDGEYDIETYD